MVIFKVLLLNRCQKEFEKDKASELDMARMEKEIAEAPVSIARLGLFAIPSMQKNVPFEYENNSSKTS